MEDINTSSDYAPEEMGGANEQDFAEPAAEEGANEQDFAEPAEDGNDAEREEMSIEERHAQAERRRNAEREADRERIRAELREEMRQDNQRQIDSFIRSQGKMNPFTNTPITTQAELDAYNEENNRRKLEQEFKRAGINPEFVRDFISSHPDIRAAKEAKSFYEAEAAKLQTQTMESGIQRELDEIGKIDPSIKSAADLLQHPQYNKIKELVMNNKHSLREAFEIATSEERNRATQNRMRQSAAAAAAGKNHMRSTHGSGGATDNLSVPAPVFAVYRAMNPHITMEEARSKYARFNKLPKG